MGMRKEGNCHWFLILTQFYSIYSLSINRAHLEFLAWSSQNKILNYIWWKKRKSSHLSTIKDIKYQVGWIDISTAWFIGVSVCVFPAFLLFLSQPICFQLVFPCEFPYYENNNTSLPKMEEKTSNIDMYKNTIYRSQQHRQHMHIEQRQWNVIFLRNEIHG